MKSIIISTTTNSWGEWIAFSSWYSFSRNAPQIKIGIVFPRDAKPFHYKWLGKCQVPFMCYPPHWKEQQAIDILSERMECEVDVIDNRIMMIRSDGELPKQVLPATEKEPQSFVDISCVGKFVLDDWIAKEKTHPFHNGSQFLGKNRTVNEQKVVAMWRQIGTTFDFINR